MKGDCRERGVVGKSLLGTDPGCHQSRHHGHCEATQPSFGLSLEPQCSRFDSHFDIVFLVLFTRKSEEVTLCTSVLGRGTDQRRETTEPHKTCTLLSPSTSKERSRETAEFRHHLMCIYSVINERPHHAREIQWETDGPVAGALNGRPAEQRSPVERQPLTE